MTNEFRYLMRLVSASARGDWAEVPDEKVDWITVEKLASDQSVQFLLGYSLKKMPKCSCPDEIRHRLIQQMRSVSMQNHACTLEIVKMLNDMEASGIHNVMFKGWTVAKYYAAPDARVSADVDILVGWKDEKRAIEFLSEKGFEIKKRWKNGHHSECFHPVYGYVEVHVRLYDEIVEEVWFQNIDTKDFVIEPHRKINDSIGEYYTLGYTDHMIFMLLHMVKHFIQTGLSLRMILDIALYYSKNNESIDIERVWNTIEKLQLNELINNVLWIAIKYCGFQAEDFPGVAKEEPKHIEMLMDDLEEGGWIGKNDKTAREDGWHEYNRQLIRKNKNQLQYKLFMLKWQWGSIRTIFPRLERMQKDFAFLKKYPLLLPFAWVLRIVKRAFKFLKDGNKTQFMVNEKENLSKSGQKRIEMFKKLNMM